MSNDNNKIADTFVNIKLRKSEALEILSTYEYLRSESGGSTAEGKYCAKIIKRIKKSLKELNK